MVLVRLGHVHGGSVVRARRCDAAFASSEAGIGKRPMARASANPSGYNTKERRGRAAVSYLSHDGPKLGGALTDMATAAMALARGPSPWFERRRERVRGEEDGAAALGT